MPRKRVSNPANDMPRHVMVVEDDAVLGLDIEQMLTSAGVEEVSICASAACTIEQLRNSRPDAIIIDVHLADSDDGWGIAEMVDAIGYRPPQIIFQTGTPQDIPEAVAKLGTILAKPYAPEELIGLLRAKRKTGILAALRRG